MRSLDPWSRMHPGATYCGAKIRHSTPRSPNPPDLETTATPSQRPPRKRQTGMPGSSSPRTSSARASSSRESVCSVAPAGDEYGRRCLDRLDQVRERVLDRAGRLGGVPDRAGGERHAARAARTERRIERPRERRADAGSVGGDHRPRRHPCELAQLRTGARMRRADETEHRMQDRLAGRGGRCRARGASAPARPEEPHHNVLPELARPGGDDPVEIRLARRVPDAHASGERITRHARERIEVESAERLQRLDRLEPPRTALVARVQPGAVDPSCLRGQRRSEHHPFELAGRHAGSDLRERVPAQPASRT